MKKTQKYCEITVWSSTDQLFKTEIPVGCISDGKLRDLLRCLVAKAGLSFQEICDANVKKNTRRYASHLEVQVESNRSRTIISCGDNPYAVALMRHRPDDDLSPADAGAKTSNA